jgi:hypothetical protein
MLKYSLGSIVIALSVVSGVYACSSSDPGTVAAAGAHSAAAGAATGGGGASATGGGGATATGGGATATGGGSGGATTTGGGGATATGGSGGSGGSGGATTTGGGAGDGAGGATLTLADACAKNCALAAGLTGCSTTTDVCVKSCLTTFDNTSKVNATLGREYTEMMVCVATDTAEFGTADKFACAKPDRALNKWSPGPDSKCEDAICLWNCNDGTSGNFDPFVDIRCTCSSV